MAQIILFDQYLQPIAGAREGTCITRGQFLQWLAANDASALGTRVCDTIPADPYDDVNICWNSGIVRIGDALYDYAQTELGLSDAAMLSAFYAAALYPLTPQV